MRVLKHTKKNSNIDKLKYDFYVFDTETTCLEPMPKNFVFGCLYGYNTRKIFYTVEDFIEEFSKPKYKDKYVFAHNAEFDLLTIFGNVFTKVDNAAIFNGKFICAKYKELLFVDSMNIYSTSVAALGNLIGLPKLENDKAKTGRLTKKNMTKEDIDYCMRDCEIVYKALLRIFEMTGVIKATLPSLAMYDFRRYYMEDDIPFKELVDEFYESYYGGRTEAFFIGKTDANVYDINSMYPKAMSQVRLPDVKTLNKTSHCDISFLKHCLKFYEGMAKVDVFHKETFFGYLPCRMKLNGNIKLVFPVGEFTTTVNFNELRFAIDSGVVQIKKVHYVIYGNPTKSIFEQYIADNYARRKQACDSLERLIYKNKMNSLYGRFAMRMKLLTTYYEMIPYEKIEELKEAAKYCDIKLFNATRADCFIVTENDKSQNSYYSIPAIASYITSEARVMLLKNLLANENNGVVYCDTDSIFLSGSFTGKVGDELGQFKKEEKKIIEVCGLKNYKYIDGEGKTHVVIKGISKGSIKKTTARCGEEVYEAQRYYKTKDSLRQGHEAGSGYTMVKRVTNNYDKREVLSDGNTRCLVSKNNVLINATTFIRPKSDAYRKKAEKKRFRYEPQDIREAVMMFFITGGKVWTEDLKSHVTGSSANELKSYFGLYSADGVHMDVFCELVPDEFYTDRIIDVFQDVLLSYNTTTKMREVLEARKVELEEKQKKQIIEYEFEYDDVPF